jgi:hypothetical protein
MTFSGIILVLISLIVVILLFRLFIKNKLYFTSFFSKEIEVLYNDDKINELLIEVIKKIKFKRINYNNSEITAITLPSIWSFSEKIKINIEQKENNKYSIIFTSKCLFPLQIFDWNKNKRNYNRFYEMIKSTKGINFSK